MQDFVDIKGASGTTYRFRRHVRGETHLRISGNFALVKHGARAFNVLFVGVTNDLSQAEAGIPSGMLKPSVQLYTRLNVSGAARDAEHEDLAACYPSEGAEPSEEAKSA